MIVFRVVLLLAALTIGCSVLVYFFTRDRRYLRFAVQVFKYSIVLALLFAALLLFERFALIL